MNICFYYPTMIPAVKYGGTERVIFWLMKELAKANNVTLIGHKLSNVKSIGVKHIAIEESDDWRLFLPKETDIIHTCLNSLDIDIPYINTIHGNEKPGTVFPKNSVFVSRDHAMRHGSLSYVYNCIDLSEYPFIRRKKDKRENYLFLANGRWPVKNLYGSMKAIKENSKKLIIAGATRKDSIRVNINEGESYSSAILSSFYPGFKFLGMIDQKKKIKTLSETDFFLWPVRWHEPFGLAVIEAYSQGIPVIASSFGSAKEIIPSIAGILCNSFVEFTDQISSPTNSFSSLEIRDYCIENFSSGLMSKNYYSYYEKILSGDIINSIAPSVPSNATPQTLLPF